MKRANNTRKRHGAGWRFYGRLALPHAPYARHSATSLLPKKEKTMSDKKYQFTGDELIRLLHDAIGLAYEYNRLHGRDMFAARNQAIVEVFEGLEYSENEIAAEHPLHSDGGEALAES